MPATNGVIPTIVIAHPAVSCKHEARAYKGIVYYGYEPVAWCCLNASEVKKFKAWAIEAFPSVQIVTVNSPAPRISCPPPVPHATDLPALPRPHEEAREKLRRELRDVAPEWFVAPTATPAAKNVA
ncbi:MAG TPA: hypothetical protein VFK02_31730 [Kofleriaceae bacterium]|nr:hypothetical protein [Kofleriaceae bacterium]